VVGVVAAFVGVPLDLDQIDPRVAVDRRGDRIDDRERLGLDDVLVGLEVDRLHRDDLALGHRREALIGAAVVVVDAVIGLGLVRALVDLVGDSVVVVVRIGAAVRVLEAVLVLGIVRAGVLDVLDAVLVVVGIGAAVRVL